VNGEGRIAYPVYEGFGNHDGSMAPGKAVAAGIAERNKTRPGVKNISDNGIHYSWDWDQLHVVQLNLYAGDLRVKMGSMDGPGHEPLFSLKFLKEDLKKNVGTSRRPVIIAMHLGFDEGFSMGWGWWAEREREAFYEAIRNYNVIGILYGHTHAAANYKWRGLDIYNCASSQRDPDPGECMVFHVTPRELVVIQRFSGRWSEVWRKPIQGLAAKP
jgi:cytolysin (calcineurin-like family phosphatase)